MRMKVIIQPTKKLNGLIKVAVQHFEEIDKVDKQLFK